MTADQRSLVIYQAQNWIAETGYSLLEKEAYSQSCDFEYQKIFKSILYITTVQDADVDLTLTEKQQDSIYKCLQDFLDLGNYPIAGIPYVFDEATNILIGQQGIPGAPGAPGANGTDADIDVVEDPDGNITVTESVILGVKTFTIKYTPYTAPAITLSLDTGVILAPDQAMVTSIGNVIVLLQVFINLTKGKNNVTASTLTSPGGLDVLYQSLLLPLTTLNTAGTQAISIGATNVATTTSYTVNITDGIVSPVPVASSTVTFVYPFLYGNTATSSTVGLYGSLSKLIRTQANQTAVLGGTNQFFWFGFPSTYPVLNEIRDQNNFLVWSLSAGGAWTIETGVLVTSTGLAANWSNVSYRFYRTTVATTIPPGSTYTFRF